MGLTACEDVPAPYELNENGTTDPTDSPVIFSEEFASSLGKCSSVATTGDYNWVIDYSCAKITSYDSETKTNNAADVWLVSPQIDLTEVDSACIYFKYILRYANESELSTNYLLCVSNNYEGDVTTATWQTLSFGATNGSDWNTWYECDYVDIPQSYMGGNVTVAIRYIAKNKAATWEVKNFAVYNGSHAKYSTNNGGGNTSNNSAVDPNAEQLTIAEFISRADANTVYQVTGTVGAIKSDKYGNYDLTDETGTITIYGTLTSTGEAQKFSSLGVKEGDKITLQGTYTLYNTTHEIKDAIYVSHESNGNGGGSEVEQGDVITLDFSANCFNITTDKTQDATTYTYGNLTCVCTGSSDAAFYFNSNDKYLMLGKQGATLTLSGFTGTVAKIEIVGTAKASAAVIQNIYVGDVAVSTETKGAQNVTNSYLIADEYRNAGTYTLKVNSKHNTQITKIIIYSTAESSTITPEVEEAPTYSFATSMPDGWTVNDVTLPSGVTSIWNIDTKYNCAKGTGYANSAKNASEGWLVSPSVTISEGVLKIVECGNYFTTSENYAKYAAVKISTDGKSWTDLSLTRTATGTAFNFATTTADLTAYKGQSVQIAFVYTSDTEIAGTWEIQSVTLK